MTERVYCFGPNAGLVGVLTEPNADRTRANAPVVLWLNAGLLHSVGPFGWYVTLARRLTEQGLTSFRFDLSGIGDSELGTDGRDNLSRGVADTTAAMDLLAREHGVRRFVLVGVCAGAVLAQHLAAHEDRVAGAVCLDGWGYRTTGYFLRHYARRLFRWRSWAHAVGRLLTRTGGNKGGKGNSDERRLLIREYYIAPPKPEQAREQLAAALSERGTHLLFLYTGGVESYFNHRRQFEEMFDRLDPRDPIEVDYLPAADHLYSGREQRLVMFDRVENWFQGLLNYQSGDELGNTGRTPIDALGGRS